MARRRRREVQTSYAAQDCGGEGSVEARGGVGVRGADPGFDRECGRSGERASCREEVGSAIEQSKVECAFGADVVGYADWDGVSGDDGECHFRVNLGHSASHSI